MKGKSKKSPAMISFLLNNLGILILSLVIITVGIAKAWDAGPPAGDPGDGNVELRDVDGKQVCIVGGNCLGAYINKVGNTYYYANSAPLMTELQFTHRLYSVTEGSYACSNASYTPVQRSTTSVSYYSDSSCTSTEYTSYLGGGYASPYPPYGSGWTCIAMQATKIDSVFSMKSTATGGSCSGTSGYGYYLRAVNNSYLISGVQIELR